jgi:hypothetical protein
MLVNRQRDLFRITQTVPTKLFEGKKRAAIMLEGLPTDRIDALLARNTDMN